MILGAPLLLLQMRRLRPTAQLQLAFGQFYTFDRTRLKKETHPNQPPPIPFILPSILLPHAVARRRPRQAPERGASVGAASRAGHGWIILVGRWFYIWVYHTQIR